MGTERSSGGSVEGAQRDSYTLDMRSSISACADIVFRYIFGAEESAEILAGFINAVQADAQLPTVESETRRW